MREGWEYKKLGEVGEVITGSTPSTKDADNYNSSDVCFVKPSDIPKEGIGLLSDSEFYISKKAYGNSRKLPKGSVLTTCIGIIGKVGILTIDATCNQQINAIIPHTDVSSSFLAYSILSKRHYLEHIANAPVVPIINKKEFSNIIIPIPPLKEQERIVSELDLLSSIIEKKKAQLKEYDQLAQSIFYDMFGDPVTNEKGWEERDIKTICSKVTDGTHDTPQRIKKGVKFITGKHIRPFFIDYENSDYVAEEVHKEIFLRCNPEFGDVLYTNIGAGIGNAAINTVKYEFSMKNVALLKIKKNVVDGHFIEFYLNYEKTKSKIIDNFSNGGAQRFLSLKAISKIPVHVPPIKLQHFFAAKIEAIEHQKSLIKQSITEMETLFNSRMDYWFS